MLQFTARHTVTPPKVNSGGTLRYVPPLFSHTCLHGPTFDAYEPSVALRAEPQKKAPAFSDRRNQFFAPNAPNPIPNISRTALDHFRKSRSSDLRINRSYATLSGSLPMIDFRHAYGLHLYSGGYRSGFTPDLLFSVIT